MGIFDKLAVFVLGLENDIWERIGKAEKNLYKSLTIAFSIFAILSLFSGYFLIYLISSNSIISIVFGLMTAYVVTSIVRFSLVILRKSVFPIPVEKTSETSPTGVRQVSGKQYHINEFAEIVYHNSSLGSNEANLSINNEPKKSSVLQNKIKSIFLGISMRSFYLDIGIVIRIVVLSMMCLIVVFPLSSLIYRKAIDSICENERLDMLSVFTQQNMKLMQTQFEIYETRIGVLDQQIDGLIKSGIDENVYGSNIKAQRESLYSEMQRLKGKLEGKFSVDYSAYQNKISNKYFLVKCFTEVSKFHLFPFVFLFVFFLLLYPHVLLIILKKGKAFKYAIVSTARYRLIIERNYLEKQSYLDDLLKNKYPGIYPSLNKVKMHSDPPFCSIKNEFFTKRKPINRAEFEASFNA
jgi:hypothetical protein